MEQANTLTNLAQLMQLHLQSLDKTHRRRQLRPLMEHDRLDFTHNDYMGLRRDQAFQSRARSVINSWPVGSGASRLLGGEHRIFGLLEKEFAIWKGTESALYFSSGYAANEALMSALNMGDAEFFSYALNHASLIDGMRLAKIPTHRKHIFPHNDVQALATKLSLCRAGLKIVVIESLYSMDGDLCPAKEMMDLCQKHGALLVVDEAHALGVYGKGGRGWMDAQGIDPSQYISVNPCGKAMGASGALICGPFWLREYLINTARSFIYTTAPSPWTAAALLEALSTIDSMDEQRTQFQHRCSRVRKSLEELGFDCGHSRSHIIPIVLGSEASALAAENFCREKGVEVRAIRPPTVAENSCRLRLSLHAGMSDADEALLIAVFMELSHELSSSLYHRHRH